MYKIATHDSATGEKSRNFISWLVRPFAQTQSKTIQEQYNAGCRSFDIRVKKYKGKWVCAHGLWKSKRQAWDIIMQINMFTDRCQVCIVYEGKLNDTTKAEFLTFVSKLKTCCTNIIWGYVAGKYSPDAKGAKVQYERLLDGELGYEGGKQGFLPLDGHSWHTYIPIPRLWDKIYTRPHIFNEDQFTYVDFL